MTSIGSATRPAPHETANGDRIVHVVRETGAIYGVIDGLGHGPKAEEAALIGLAVLREASRLDVRALFDAVHLAMRGSRGAAMTLVTIEGTKCEAAGVGNVTLRAHGIAGLSLASTPGVVGAQMRSLRIARGEVGRSARLAIWSDGISSRAPIDDHASVPPQQAADRVLAAHAIAHDDATILVVDL